MKILFCGGGTAGHIMPAIAMCEMIGTNIPHCEFAFVGRQGGEENMAIKKEGYKLYTIDIEGIKRSVSFKNILSVFKLLKSGRTAKMIINDFRPDIVIGTGGYVCYPIIRTAQRMHIKTVIHESNAYPGLVTRMLGSRCDKVLLNMEKAKEHMRDSQNIEVVGNPIRQKFDKALRKDARRKLGISQSDFFIVSFGGSLGSEVMNEAVAKAMSEHLSGIPNLRHLHSAGKKKFDFIKQKYPKLCSGGEKCKIVPYIDDMPTVMCAADLAITRSGAITLSELAEVGIASILIPSPNVAANHQYKNAKFMEERNAAILIEEKNLTSQLLCETIDGIRSNDALRATMRSEISKCASPDVAKKIIKTIRSLE